MDDIQISELSNLMAEWRDEDFNRGMDKFIYDGYIDKNSYLKAPKRILFLLKECYFNPKDKEERPKKSWVQYMCQDKNGKWSYNLCANLQQHPAFMMWRKAERITELFSETLNLTDAGDILTLKYCSIVNLKKSKYPENNEADNGRPYTELEYLMNYVNTSDNKEKLIRQIKLLDPQIIICGGTYSIANECGILGQQHSLVKSFENGRGIKNVYLHTMNDGQCIPIFDMYHPAYSIRYEDIRKELIELGKDMFEAE